MRRYIPAIFGIALLSSCALPGQRSSLDVNPYLSDKEREVINRITFEVQKVLDTIDGFRSSHALDYVVKLDIPGWKTEKREEKIFFLTQKEFVAIKDYNLPESCVKEIGSAEVNVCHLKLTETLRKLAEAYNCDVKTYSTHLEGLRERVEIICTY